MFTHNIDPVLFSVGPLKVHYYGLVYVLGFLLAYWCLVRFSNWKKDKAEDFITYAVLGVVVGGRLGYFLFYSASTLWENPLEVLMIWHGGMSFHGALLGIIYSTYLFAKKRKVSFFDIADPLSIPALVALGFGRMANFINGEVVGTVSNLPWCVEFQRYEGCRHPVQLYLSLKNFVVAAYLYYLNKGKLKKGALFWQFILWYGVGRFLIEFVRFEARFLGLSTGQYLNLAMVFVALYFLKR